ncbi:hypothetical protein M3484_23350 [Pseudomonas sp. GX19020]|uniref:hypothetical protein n=1 Tax=Pseudomonas sp. GX19020 TaxID=2942277 RepID=UPI002018C895|nr:hypothetical protein [Pseudomonas sp. GX19020]MCL4069496.1 hypothetical protein [Pseudomonas sp. GX19020]
MKNRGVFNSGSRLPGMGHKTEGRPEMLPGQISAPLVGDRPSDAKQIASRPAEKRLPVSARSTMPLSSAASQVNPKASSPKRKYSLSLRIDTDIADGFERLLASYPAASGPSIRRDLAAQVQDHLTRDLPRTLPLENARCQTLRLDLRLSTTTVDLLRHHHDPHAVMPVTTMLARAVEPIYSTLLRNLLCRTGKLPSG